MPVPSDSYEFGKQNRNRDILENHDSTRGFENS